MLRRAVGSRGVGMSGTRRQRDFGHLQGWPARPSYPAGVRHDKIRWNLVPELAAFLFPLPKELCG